MRIQLASTAWRAGLLLVLATNGLRFATAYAAQSVDSALYAVNIRYHAVSEVALEKGLRGLELKLTVRNGGSHPLYDLRVFLARTGSAATLLDCAPATLRKLPAGESAEITWTYECLHSAVPRALMRQLQFRVEAVDRATQKIVTFPVFSREES